MNPDETAPNIAYKVHKPIREVFDENCNWREKCLNIIYLSGSVQT